MGYAPTGKPVSWLGAALFNFALNKISELWLLGDQKSLNSLLEENKA